jgi:RHS repeat-associated protein
MTVVVSCGLLGLVAVSKGLSVRKVLFVIVLVLLAAAASLASGATTNAGNGDDLVIGTGTADVIDAGNGNDRAEAREGNDVVFGGNGNDELFGESGSDSLHGENGNDLLDGGLGSDSAWGGNGNDHFVGGEGHDWFDGDNGNDTAFGGPGLDTLLADNGGADLLGGGDSDVLALIGSGGSPTLDGGAGRDVIVASKGVIRGGDGDDVLVGSSSGASIDAGAGNDVCYVASGVSTTGCEQTIQLGNSNKAASLILTEAPADWTTVESDRVDVAFKADDSRAVWCVASTGAVADCSSGSFSVTGLTEGEHAIAVVAFSDGSKPPAIQVRRFDVELPNVAPLVESAASPAADTLRVQTRALGTVHGIRAMLESGRVATWQLDDPAVSVDPPAGLSASIITIVDPVLGRERVVRLELLADDDAVLASLDVDVWINSSVQLSAASSSAASTLTIDGARLSIVDRIRLVHADGVLDVLATDAGVHLADTQVEITSALLDGLHITRIEALITVGTPKVVATLDVDIHVQPGDQTAPEITVPDDRVVEAQSASGAVVQFDASAIDDADGPVVVTCDPASGSTFAMGETVVSCAAQDQAGNQSQAMFTVQVVDTTAPVLQLPDTITVDAPDSLGAEVEYEATAVDAVDGPRAVVCVPASGSRFSIGTTIVTCASSDSLGNASSATFLIKVRDVHPPVLTVPANLTIEATSRAGATATFDTTAIDAVDGAVGVMCSAESGSMFMLGDTTVTCAATDVAGNESSDSFIVRVQDTTAPTLEVPSVVEASAASASGATVEFEASATDLVDGVVGVICTPATGSTFAVGVTIVACVAVDVRGNSSAATFDVRVNDDGPILTFNGAIDQYVADPAGGPIYFDVSSEDSTGAALPVTCNPASGSVHPVGPLEVTCTAEDSAGNTSTLVRELVVRYREPFAHAESTITNSLPQVWQMRHRVNLPLSTLVSLSTPTRMRLLVADGAGGTQAAVAHGLFGYELPDGSVAAIDTTLQARVGGGWSPRGVGYDAWLPARYADGLSMGLGVDIGGGRIEFAPIGTRVDAPAGQIVQSGDQLLYPAVWTDTDVLDTALGDRIAEHLIVKSADAPREFSWNVTHPAGTSLLIDVNGAVVIEGSNGAQQVVVPRPLASDAEGFPVGVAYDLTSTTGGTRLALTWQDQPELVIGGDPIPPITYPIAIDPPVLGPQQYPIENLTAADPPVAVTGDGAGVYNACNAAILDLQFQGRTWKDGGRTIYRTIDVGSEASCAVGGPRDGESWVGFFGSRFQWGFSSKQKVSFTDEAGGGPTVGSRSLQSLTYTNPPDGREYELSWMNPTKSLAFRLTALSRESLSKYQTRAAQIYNPVAIFVDTTPPAVFFSPALWPARISPLSRDITLSITQGDGSGCGGASVTLSRLSAPVSTAPPVPFNECGGSTTLPAGLAPGNYSIAYTAYDRAGNVATGSKQFTIVDPMPWPRNGANLSATAIIKTELLDDLPAGNVILSVEDGAGRITELVNEPALDFLGERDTTWNTLSVPNGEYTVTLRINGGPILATRIVSVYNDILMGQQSDLSSSSITGGLTATHVNGNVTLHNVDMSISALGVDLTMDRTYNSQLPGNGTLGRANWRAGFEQELVLGDHGYVRFVDPTGTQFEYTDHGDGAFNRAPGLEADLTRDVGGSFELRANDGTIQRFDTQGRWAGTTTPNGNDVVVTRDLAGRVQRIADESGLDLDFVYDASGRLVSVEDPALGSARYLYDAAGDLVTYRDMTGAEWTYTYNANNNLVAVKSPISTTPAQVVYNQDGLDEQGDPADGTVSQLIDAVGNTTHLEYDFDAATVRVPVTPPAGSPSTTPAYTYTINASGRRARMVSPEPASQITDYAYDAQLRLLSAEESNPRRNSYTYDARGNVLTETLVDLAPDSGDPTRLGTLVTTYAGYNEFGQPTSVTDPKGNTTVSTYDTRGNLETQRSPGGGTTSYEYDAVGLLVAMVDPKDRRTEYTYDTHGWLTQTLNPDQSTTGSTYDANGNLIAGVNENGDTVTYVRDAAGRTLSVTDESGVITSSTYDGEGNELTSTSGTGGVTRNAYSGNGQLTTSRDPMNRLTSYAYDQYGNQTTMTNPNNRTWTYTYDAQGNQRTERDPLNNVTVHDYDRKGRLITTTAPGNAITRSTYDHADNLLTSTDGDGNVTRYEYYPDGSLRREINGEGDVTAYVYDPNGNTQTRTNADGTVETSVYDDADQLNDLTSSAGIPGSFEYDLRGRQYSSTTPVGTSSTAFDAAGREQSRTNVNNNTTAYTFDEAGRLLTQTNPDGGVVTLAYDDAGETIGAIDARGKSTGIVRDLSGRMTRMNHPDGTFTTYLYDAAGNLTEARDQPSSNPNTGVSRFTYDAANRMLTARTETGDTYSFTYDGRGNVASQLKNFVYSTTYGYTGANRLRTLTNSGQTSTFTYDDAGRLARRVTPVGTIDYTYIDGKLASIADSVSGTTTYNYDNFGRVSSQTEPEGTTSYTYDSVSRVRTITQPDGAVSTYGYDAVGNVTSIASATGEQSIEYDENERPERLVNPDGEVRYTYDPQSNVTGTNAYGKPYAYEYDSRGRMASQTKPDGTTSEYEYTNSGFLSKVTHGNGDVTTYTYDNNERLQFVTSDSGFARSYSYYSSGDLGTATNPTGPTQGYSFYTFTNNNTGALQNFYSDDQDFIDQHYYQYGGVLTAQLFVRPRTNATPAEIPVAFRQLVLSCMNPNACTDPDIAAAMIKFQAINPVTDRASYTDIENRVAQVLWNFAPARYLNTMAPATGRLTSRDDRIAGTTSSYAYDSAGNLANRTTRRTTTSAVLSEDEFTFDKRDRMTRYSRLPGGDVVDYAYDDQGRLTRIIEGAATTALRYDLDGRLVQETAGSTDITYAYNPLGLESMTLTLAGGTTESYYYEFNTRGDVIHLVDSSGTIAATYHYDAWGNQRTEGDPALLQHNRFTYSARSGTIYVRPMGMYFMGIRWYDPTQQRFISEDPAGTDPNTHANTYSYANNNPITNIDATGLTARPVRTFNHSKPTPLPESAPSYPSIAAPTVFHETPRTPVAPAPTLSSSGGVVYPDKASVSVEPAVSVGRASKVPKGHTSIGMTGGFYICGGYAKFSKPSSVLAGASVVALCSPDDVMTDRNEGGIYSTVWYWIRASYFVEVQTRKSNQPIWKTNASKRWDSVSEKFSCPRPANSSERCPPRIHRYDVVKLHGAVDCGEVGRDTIARVVVRVRTAEERTQVIENQVQYVDKKTRFAEGEKEVGQFRC